MATTIVDKTACELAGQGQEDGLLPVSPFTALQFHFGMLLGVDDLETSQAYPRGKIRLHNAWLHREGVVWGMGVSLNERHELAVDSGLALDAAGHELHLDRQACLELGKWYAENKDDKSFTFEDAGAGRKRFSVHVVAKFTACLTRPVPAIVEPCSGASTDTAYSRAFETIELLLRPGRAKPRPLPYPRLRILFGVGDDGDAKYQAVRDRVASIQAQPASQQSQDYLKALREFAAYDEIDLKPQPAQGSMPASIFPEDPTEVVLADVADILLQPGASDTWVLATPFPTPDVTVRTTHIATATVQELLCGPSAPAVKGPVIDSASVNLSVKTLRVEASRQLAAATVKPAAFSVTDYDDTNGWSPMEIDTVALHPNGTTVEVNLKDNPQGTWLRFIARGTGAAPLLAKDGAVPLGAPGAGGADDGIDFVKMIKRS